MGFHEPGGYLGGMWWTRSVIKLNGGLGQGDCPYEWRVKGKRTGETRRFGRVLGERVVGLKDLRGCKTGAVFEKWFGGEIWGSRVSLSISLLPAPLP